MKRTKVFMDCELTGLVQNTELISIGKVDENGRAFYAEMCNLGITSKDPWIMFLDTQFCEWFKICKVVEVSIYLHYLTIRKDLKSKILYFGYENLKENI